MGRAIPYQREELVRDDLFEESIWTPTETLPDLSSEKVIAIDVETRDPKPKDLGSGLAA